MTTITRSRPGGKAARGEPAATIALAGNPNVGKSTIFNRLTGLKQHTGNWPGKTVGTADGTALLGNTRLRIVDTPGAYSLMAHSAEEEVTRDYICFHHPDCVVVVADATCLERNLNLALQIREITPRMVLCVNLLDEARRKGLQVDLEALSRRLGAPVVGTSARRGKGLEELLCTAAAAVGSRAETPPPIAYPAPLEAAIDAVASHLHLPAGCTLPRRWLAGKLLEGEPSLLRALEEQLGISLREPALGQAVRDARANLQAVYPGRPIGEIMVETILDAAGSIHGEAVRVQGGYRQADRKLDKILTSKRWGIPLMLALLLLVFWITVVGANYPSQLLSDGFGKLEDLMRQGLTYIGTPDFLTRLLTDGIARTLFWVVSVMLPPMAIFFPLFTLSEDLGYLPRVAFNLDHCFANAKACGKQALTMCMGLGCNAVGVTGCRIIDSPRERLLAVLTNTFMPCNGRFPAMIAVSSLFFASAAGFCQSVLSAAALLVIISIGVLLTLLVSRLLSATILKGAPSAFTLELPPYRRPDVLRVICRSTLDRTLFVLGRAVTVAAPAGLIIFLLANVQTGGGSLLDICAGFLDPLGRLMGLDGYILMAFILGFPANEIVIPIVLMSYLSAGSMLEAGSLMELRSLLTDNGWTTLTALCFLTFSLIHFPCSTTCLTIRKETGSWKWTAVAFLLPTLLGILLCICIAALWRLFFGA